MSDDPHQRAAEFHELAAQAHRAAAGHRDKQHHRTGQEYSKQAIEHANKAFQASQEAIHEADNLLLATEAEQLMSPLHPEWKDRYSTLADFPLPCWNPSEAKEHFLTRFARLTR